MMQFICETSGQEKGFTSWNGRLAPLVRHAVCEVSAVRQTAPKLARGNSHMTHLGETFLVGTWEPDLEFTADAPRDG